MRGTGVLGGVSGQVSGTRDATEGLTSLSTGAVGTSMDSTSQAMFDAPSSPVARGTMLRRLSTYPTGTVGAFAVDGVSTRDAYDIEFRPFGASADSPPKLVVQVTKSNRVSGRENELKLAGVTIMVDIPPSESGAVLEGGRYSGRISFREYDSMVWAQISDVKVLP